MVKSIYRLIRLFVNFIFFPIVVLGCLCINIFPKKVDVGIGPLPLINNIYWKKALEKKAYKVETYVNSLYFITDEFDYIFDKNLIYRFLPILLFLRTIRRYKIVYIYFDGGPLQVLPFYRRIEPLLFRLANTKVVVMPYGSDSQIFDKTKNKLMVNALCQDYSVFFKQNYRIIKNNVYTWSRYADIVIGAMDSVDYLHYWNRIRQCHYAIDVEKIQPVYLEPQEVVRILHAPNHKEIKGTRFVENAITELKEEGYKIEYVFQQGLPNNEFIKLIQSVDIVIDQLIIGWHGIFALESMAAGKPTICNIREDLLYLYEGVGCIEAGELPLVNASIINIKEVIRNLVENKNKLNVIGKKSRAYVEKYHSLDAVGDFFDEINRSLKIK